MGGECNTGGLFLDNNNNLFVGTVNGLIKFNPDLYRSNNFFPKTHITGISVFYRDTLFIENLKLKYNQNNIKFTFIGLSFSNPEKILYSYKLNGFDKLWSPPSPENTAKYSNLPPGKYQLLVKSCNDEKIWTPNPVEYSFEILKPFWKKWWFIFAITVFFTALIYAFVRQRILKIKQIEQFLIKFNDLIRKYWQILTLIDHFNKKLLNLTHQKSNLIKNQTIFALAQLFHPFI